MKVLGDWNSSIIKTSSGKKSTTTSTIRRKLERIKQKVRSGARLSASEKAFLRKYAPELYLRAVEQERQEDKKEEFLKRQRQREKADQERQEEMRQEKRIIEEVEVQEKGKKDNMEDFIDKEHEIARQLEAMIKEESMEKSRIREAEEEQEYEVHDGEGRKFVREFEADVLFRTHKPVLSEEASERIPAFVQGRAAYQTMVGADSLVENEAVLKPRKA